jgi:hypothetical protein
VRETPGEGVLPSAAPHEQDAGGHDGWCHGVYVPVWPVAASGPTGPPKAGRQRIGR